jgi:NAD(P)-dependent dehydrogenase (short-subunit alcohol dehydrogenase family)
MTAKLADSIALVTGAANGIGRATALRLAKDGARLALLDLEAGPLADVAEEVRAAGGEVLDIEADCTADEPVEEAIMRIRERFALL